MVLRDPQGHIAWHDPDAAPGGARRRAAGMITVVHMTSRADLSLVVVLAAQLAACSGDSTDRAGADASVDGSGAVTWDGFARGFFETYCWACHGPGDAVRDFSLLEEVRAEAETIAAGVGDGTFPIGDGPKPTQLERERLVEWIDLGTPE